MTVKFIGPDGEEIIIQDGPKEFRCASNYSTTEGYFLAALDGMLSDLAEHIGNKGVARVTAYMADKWKIEETA